MNFSFENQGTHTFLVYAVAEDDIIDSMSIGMLTNNKIQGLAHTVFTQRDQFKFIKYDVSAKISVNQFFNGQVNKKRLLGVFNGIVDAMLSAEEYMIDVNSLFLDLDYIFADVSTCETVLVCLPIESETQKNVDLGLFFKNIMFTTQFDQTENCDHVTKILNYLNGTPVFSLNEFKKLLDSIAGHSSVEQKHQPAVQNIQIQQKNDFESQKENKNVSGQQPSVTSVPKTNNTTVNVSSTQKSNPNNQEQEKKISMFGLLMHYSKENAELYKKQKAEKKAGQTTTSTSATQQKKNQTNVSFAIPGQNIPIDQGVETIAKQPAVQPSVVSQEKNKTSDSTITHSQITYNQPSMPQGQAMNFGETTVLGSGGSIGETTVLGVASGVQANPRLIRTKNNEKIDLNKPVFRIGKEKSYVDYFIGDNSAISRSHANIISKDGEFFVVDTNSTNHTYVDGQMIPSNVETKIVHGSKIKLANEDFLFEVY